MTWEERAAKVIGEVHKTLPDTMGLRDRRAAIDAAYPFGQRKYFPYKAWLKARKKYLQKYGHKPEPKAIHLSPLERMMKKAKEAEQSD